MLQKKSKVNCTCKKSVEGLYNFAQPLDSFASFVDGVIKRADAWGTTGDG